MLIALLRVIVLRARVGFRIVQDRADDDLILLAQPTADMILSDGGRVAVQAKQGSYHRDLETLQLAGGVDLVHDQGYEIRTSSANVDLTTKTAEGNDPVAGKGPFGEIRSQGFRASLFSQRSIILPQQV